MTPLRNLAAAILLLRVLVLAFLAPFDPLSIDGRGLIVERFLAARQFGGAAAVAWGAVRLYPGNAQVAAMLSAALLHRAVHGGGGWGEASAAAGRTSSLDPLSADALEQRMFLLSYRRGRGDLDLFRRLGVRRAMLTKGAPLAMRCRLCGRHWLEHRVRP